MVGRCQTIQYPVSPTKITRFLNHHAIWLIIHQYAKYPSSIPRYAIDMRH